MGRSKQICCWILLAVAAAPAVVGHSLQTAAPKVLADGGAPMPPPPPWTTNVALFS
jgi:hypothetical protein